MKKTLSLVFAFALVLAVMLGLASCGKDVEFNVNFVVDGEVYATVGTSGNESVKIPENPSKDGYIFDGWYWDNGDWQKPFTANSLLDAPLSSDMSVYAKWNCNHVASDWITDKDATCKDAGSKHKECNKCEEVLETATIDKHSNHTPAEAVTENYVDSTCKVEGSYDEVVYCSVCGVEISRTEKTVEKKTTHTPSEAVTEHFVDSTCKVEGSYDEVVYCSVCDVEISRTEKTVAKKTTHTSAEAKTENFVDSTCKVEGSYDEVVYCSVCGIEICRTEKTVEKKTTHTPAEAVTENFVDSTCKVEGSYDEVVYCSICGVEISRIEKTVAKKTTHTPGEAIIENFVDSTCKVEGSYDEVVYCSICGVEISRTQKNVAKKNTHTPAEAVTENFVDSTCKVEGSYDEVVYCSVCGVEISRTEKTVEKKEHTEVVDKAVAPTCTGTGLTAGSHCSVCNEVLVAQTVIPANGHSYGEWEIIKQPTESASGEKRRDCANCDAFETDTVAPLSHDHSRWDVIVLDAVAPDCINTGLTEGKKCSGCGEILLAQKTVSAIGHKSSDAAIENTIKPDCTNKGSYENVVYCSVCKDEISREIVIVDETGHSHNSVVTAPTCTEKGFTTHTCHCGDTYVDTYVDAKGHTTVIDAAKEPTCTATGLTEGAHCSACGKVLVAQESIDALGHIEHNCNGKEATCLESGWNAYFVCLRSGCGYSSYEEIAPLGHDEIQHAEIPATCQRVGASAYVTCSRCDYHTESVELPIVDHLFENYELSVEDLYYCTHSGLYRTAYCEYGCGERSDMIAQSGTHEYWIDANYVAPGKNTIGYYEFQIGCQRCKAIIDERTVYVVRPDANSPISDQDLWLNNKLLADVPYPKGMNCDTLLLDYVNEMFDDSCYGYAGGYFTASNTEQIHNYVKKLKRSIFSHNVTETSDSFIGYNSSGSLKLVVGYIDTSLFVVVYKMTNIYIDAGSSNSHIHRYDAYSIYPGCTHRGVTAYYCYCGEYYAVWDPPIPHSHYTVYPTIAPSCTETGLTQGRYCYYCEKMVVLQKEIAALGHDDENGICTRCGDLIEYTVTFIAEGNVVDTCIYTIETTSVKLPVIPEKRGHTGVWEYFELGVSDIVVNAQYTPNTYSITYVLDGGINDAKNPSKYTYGDKITLRAPTTKEPLVIFGGWFTDPAFTEQFAISTISPYDIGDITLYAQWIYYRIESAEGFEIDYSGDMPTLRIRIPSSSVNFDFKKKIIVSEKCTWNVYGDEYSSVEYALRLVPVTEGNNVYYIVVFHPGGEYYTQYKVEIYRRESYTYEYLDFNGNIIASGTYDEDSELPTIEPPIYKNFTFVGWSDGNEILEYPVVPDKNIALTPVYSAKYKVEYYLENLDKTDYELIGTEELSGLTNKVMVAEVLEIPHFTFNAEDSIINGSFSLTEKLVLKIYYERNTYTVSMSGEGGNIIGAGSYPYGTSIELIANVSAQYFEFLGWFFGEELLSSELEYSYEILDRDIEARFDTIKELKPFYFTYTETTCTITGLKDKTIATITIPDCVTSIGEDAFYNCYSLTSITIPDSVTSIGSNAFRGCSSLTIYCEAASKPSGWNSNWNSSNCPVVWGCTDFGISEEGLLWASTNSVLYIIGYRGTNTELIIPETINGKSVTQINSSAFRHCDNLTSVTIPDSVTSIGSYAFCSCTSLTSVTIGNSVTTIGYAAFYNCTSLTSITIPDSVTIIDSYAFENCTGLTIVTIGNSVTSIGNYAFYGCTALEEIYFNATAMNDLSSSNYVFYNAGKNGNGIKVVIGKNVTKIPAFLFYTYSDSSYLHKIINVEFEEGSVCESIGEYAFYGCTGLTSVTIPESVTSIGNYAFSGCTGIEEIYFNAIAMNDLSSSNCVFSDAGKNGNGIKVVIGKNVTKIPAYLFSYSPKIVSVEFEENSVCKSGGTYAFYNCTSLTSVYITDIAAWCNISFANSSANPLCYARNLYINGELLTELVIIPNEVTSIGAYAFYNQTNLVSVLIGNSVTSIGEGVFYGCTSLTSVTIGNSVTSIGNAAFYNCTSLTSVYITDIAAWCNISFGNSYSNPLYYAKNLYLNGELVTELVIPNEVTSIGRYAFYNCTSLTSVTIPDSVTSIGSSAFSGCTSLKSVTIGNSVTTIGSSAFYNCTSLTSIVIPDSVTSIGSSAFSGCSSLESITLPFVGSSANATSASSSTLFGYIFGTSSYNGGVSTKQHYGSSSYSTYYIPASLKSVTITGGKIHYGAFYYCTGLTSVTIGNSVTSIGTYAFEYCASLTSVTIGNSVTSISSYAFYDCESLTSVTIGNSVTSIGSYAFYYCTGIEEIYFNAIAMNDLSSCNYVFSYAGQNGEGINVVIGKNVTKIPAYLFYPYSSSYSPKLISVEFEENSVCESIGSHAFRDCTGLTSITIPDSVTSIGSSAFYNSSLTSITIGNSVTSIGNYAFEDCTRLTIYCEAASKPSGWNSNWNYSNCPVIWGCTGFGISKEGLLWASTSSDLYIIGYRGTNTELVVPESINGKSVTKINSYAFYNCTGLTSVTIGNSVTTIGNYAFYNCTGIEEIYFNAIAMNALRSDNYVFYNAGKNGNGIKVVIGKNVTKIPADLFYPYSSSYSPKLISVEFEENSVCKSIGSSAFRYCASLTSVTIPDSVTSIDSYAFYGCTSLTSVTIGDNVKSIGYCAFSYCSSLTSVIIGDGVTSIGGSAFYGCTSLTSVIIGDGVTSIGGSAFYGCTSLTSVTIPDSVTSIGSYAFYNCTSLTSVTIPDSVTSIDSSVFYNCTGLTIFCEPTSKPSGWDSNWNYSNCPVVWGYSGEEYTYNFVTNGAEYIESISSSVTVSLPILEREGYHFMGWYDNADFAGNSVSNPYYSATAHTLYAKWLTEEEYLALPDGTSFEKAYIMTTGQTLDAVIDIAGEYVYFKFTATESKTYTFQSIGSYDTYGYLYNSSQSQLSSNDDGAGDRNFLISRSMSAGEVVYLKVKLYSSSSTGTFTVSVS